jgi:hypothetical protein
LCASAAGAGDRGRPRRRPPSFRLADIAAELREATAVLDPLEGDELATVIRAVFSWSYHALPADTARLFRLLEWQPGPEIAIAAGELRRGATPDRRALFGDVATGHLEVGLAAAWGQARPRAQAGGAGEPGGVADLGHDHRG